MLFRLLDGYSHQQDGIIHGIGSVSLGQLPMNSIDDRLIYKERQQDGLYPHHHNVQHCNFIFMRRDITLKRIAACLY